MDIRVPEGATAAQLQDIIDAIPIDGGRILFSPGLYEWTTYVTMKSNVVFEGLGKVVIEGTFTDSETNYGVFYTTEDLSYTVLKNLIIDRKSGGKGGAVSFNGANTYEYEGCKILECTLISANSVAFPYSCGPGLEVRNSIIKGTNSANGNAVEVGYVGEPKFYGCTILGGDGVGYTHYGVLISDVGNGSFFDCYIYGGTRGAQTGSGGNSVFIGCEIVSGGGNLVALFGASSPTFLGCYIHPELATSQYTYTGTAQIPPLFSGKAYRVRSLNVYVDTEQAGITMDIGSVASGSDIASALSLATAGHVEMTEADWSILLAADAPLYLTFTGGTPANGSFRVFLCEMIDVANSSIRADTVGRARFVNCYIIGNPGGVYLLDEEVTFIDCFIECPDSAKYAVNYSVATSKARFRNCTLVGALRNVTSWSHANSGTGTITSGNTSITVTHGLDGTPNVEDITITLAENPTNTPGAIWVDTIGSTTFQVNCENDPGASNLDFGWRAQVL